MLLPYFQQDAPGRVATSHLPDLFGYSLSLCSVYLNDLNDFLLACSSNVVVAAIYSLSLFPCCLGQKMVLFYATSLFSQFLTYLPHPHITSFNMNPQDCDSGIGSRVLAIIWILAALAIIIVAMRAYSQQRVVRKLGWSDFFILLALARKMPLLS